MSLSLPETLAQIDDPETIQDILNSVGVEVLSESDDKTPSSPTLEDLYERYLSRRENRSPATRAQYKRTIPEFIAFSKAQGVTIPSGLSIELVDRYVDEVKQKHEADATQLTYTKNVRSWLRWLSKRQYCDEAVYRVLDKDELNLDPTVRDEAIPESVARHIIERLGEQRYGSKMHAIIEVGFNGGLRIGDLHSLDVKDFRSDENTIVLRHRPDTGTRLKNGEVQDNTPGDGERDVIVKDRVIDAIQWYIDNVRPDVTDEYSRSPLFATKQGRASKSTLRRWIYEATSCRWAPDESEINYDSVRRNKPITCDGGCDPDLNVCPYSYCPHAIRRGAIVNHLSNGLYPSRASERFDVSIPVLKKHYDPRTKRKQKMDRSDAVQNAWSVW
ncbi:site-specific integrase [Natronolimnobius sp. AArcel1]|uniref:tyrosine-type recombinase/integrase n=1 Tax=Natronolimnobius sp. AArcel1 TaxID=1679093 RepID=UPI0013ECE0D7|nr:site-specific integrase [Natronolimnobius sp. AArcel1]NGM70259.1 site-specific integrase [Natronolimnobius sp. AArcel1]